MSTKIALAIFGIVVIIWSLWPWVYDSIRHTNKIAVYEGLPHQHYEADLLKQELKLKPTIEHACYALYRQPLILKPEDIETFRGLLAYDDTYLTHWVERECGGFHPDYSDESTSSRAIRDRPFGAVSWKDIRFRMQDLSQNCRRV